MAESHLTPEQIVEIRDGELRDWAVTRHLRSCPDCQSHLREARALRVLLGQPEPTLSPHPAPEELATYAEETLPGGDVRRLEPHLAACPRCFADLDAIRAHLRPAAAAEETPPEWVVAAATRNFRPPRLPLTLGTLVVEWLRRFRFSLQWLPPVEPGPPVEAVAYRGDVSAMARPRTAAAFSLILGESAAQPAEATVAPPVPPSAGGPATEEEAGPVEVTVGHLLARITARGRSRDQVKLIIAVTRRQDKAPVAAVHLALKAGQEPPATAWTDEAGTAEFSLPQGSATLTFLSPVHAELAIVF